MVHLMMVIRTPPRKKNTPHKNPDRVTAREKTCLSLELVLGEDGLLVESRGRYVAKPKEEDDNGIHCLDTAHRYLHCELVAKWLFERARQPKKDVNRAWIGNGC